MPTRIRANDQTGSADRTKYKRGRPSSPFGEKKNRSLYITDSAYENLQKLVIEQGASNLSDFLERVARGEFNFEPPKRKLDREFSDVLTFHKLRALLQEPISVLQSTVAFTQRLAFSLDVKLNDEYARNVIRNAMTVLFYLGYLNPDQYIDSPTAWLRWYIFQILQNRAKLQNQIGNHPPNGEVPPNKFDKLLLKEQKQQRNECIATIYQARHNLDKRAQTTSLFVLKLRMTPYNLSFGQIRRVCRAEGEMQSGLAMLNQGVEAFRKRWLRREDVTAKMPERYRAKLSQAFKYCSLFQKGTFSEDDIHAMQNLLKEGLSKPDYDFWANEIDYYLSYIAPNSPVEDIEWRETIIKALKAEFNDQNHHFLLKEKEEVDRAMLERHQAQGLNAFLLKKASYFLEFDERESSKDKDWISYVLNPLGHEVSNR